MLFRSIDTYYTVAVGLVSDVSKWSDLGFEKKYNAGYLGSDKKNTQIFQNALAGITLRNVEYKDDLEGYKTHISNLAKEDAFLNYLFIVALNQRKLVIYSKDFNDYSSDKYKVWYNNTGKLFWVNEKDNKVIASGTIIGEADFTNKNYPKVKFTINLDTAVRGKTTFTSNESDGTVEGAKGDGRVFQELITQIASWLDGINEPLGAGGGGGGGGYSPPPPPPPPKGPILLNVYDNLKFNDEDINEFIEVNKTHTQLLLNELSKLSPPKEETGKTEQQLPPSFLPFELSMDVDGISGMVLFQKFLVTNDVFPPQYEDNFDLIVTGVNHTVSLQGWSTNIKTRVTPSDPKNKDVLRPAVLAQQNNP